MPGYEDCARTSTTTASRILIGGASSLGCCSAWRGRSAVHIALSQRMAARLKRLYRLERVLSISNSVFLPQPQFDLVHSRPGAGDMGFISNLSVEKGIFEYLDLMRAVQARGLPVRALLAGPFDDPGTEVEVRALLSTMDCVDYVGPQYDEGKNRFFSGIDAFVFPTQHPSEAEPVVIHEAMSRGIPVIACGRGMHSGDCQFRLGFGHPSRRAVRARSACQDSRVDRFSGGVPSGILCSERTIRLVRGRKHPRLARAADRVTRDRGATRAGECAAQPDGQRERLGVSQDLSALGTAEDHR